MRRLLRWLTDPDVHGRLLNDDVNDEVIADHVRKHLVCYLVPGLLVLLGLALWLWSLTLTEAGWFPFLLGAGLVVWGVVRGLQRNIDQFVVTDQKVFRVHGLLNRQEASMPLTRILDTTVYKPLHGRLLNFGHFTFESAAQEQGLREIRYVRNIDARNLKIQEVTRNAGLRGNRARP